MSTVYQLGASSSSGLMGSQALSISASACINSVMVGDVAMPSTVHHTDPNAASAKVLDLPLSQTAYLRSAYAYASPLMSASAMATQIVQACMKASDVDELLVFGAMKNQLGLENRNKLPQEDPGEAKMACRSNDNKVQPRDCGEQEVVVMGDDYIMDIHTVSKSSSTNDRKQKGTSTSSYTKVPLSLTKQQWEWLENMTTKHKLSSMDKAIRCCVNCVALEGVNVNHTSAATTNSQQEIDSSSININNRGEEHIQQGIIKQVGLSNEQLSWLDAKFQQNNGQGVARRFIQSCMEMEEHKVFGIIRCKSSVAKCDGAQKSIDTIIAKQYGQKIEEVVVKENIDVSSSEKCGCDHVVGQGCNSRKQPKSFDFFSWHEYCKRHCIILEDDILLKQENDDSESQICIRCKECKHRNNFSQRGWDRRSCRNCNKAYNGGLELQSSQQRWRTLHWQMQPEALCLNGHTLQKVEEEELHCSLCDNDIQWGKKQITMECKKCDWKCCYMCFDQVKYKIRNWGQLEASPVLTLNFTFPADTELFHRGRAPTNLKKGMDMWVMDIRNAFRSIEEEQIRLDTVAPYCVPGNCCDSNICCGILEHKKYASMLKELYNSQRGLAIGGKPYDWPLWASSYRVWIRCYEEY